MFLLLSGYASPSCVFYRKCFSQPLVFDLHQTSFIFNRKCFTKPQFLTCTKLPVCFLHKVLLPFTIGVAKRQGESFTLVTKKTLGYWHLPTSLCNGQSISFWGSWWKDIWSPQCIHSHIGANVAESINDLFICFP